MLTSTRDDRVFAYGGRDGRDTLVDNAATTKSAVAVLVEAAKPAADFLFFQNVPSSSSRMLTSGGHKYFMICEMRTDSYCELVT